jgi:uncharacterized protein (DUF952 family)
MIYHITTERGWQIAREMGEYRAESLRSQGFIHCSTREQIPKVAGAFYKDTPNLVVLGIDVEKLSSPLQWEVPVPLGAVEDEDVFPHVYGPIDLDAVVSIAPLPEFLERDSRRAR